ncbi:MAG: metallophosphoesterase family protein [Prevotellaceae bacterium]|jgi:predicted phosphodiesterase|nr:metallophosphoesterase family protein [Prevotellaceae bacterium]
MKKIISLWILLFAVLFTANAQNTLKFNRNGKFKIVQFTDTHFIANDPRSEPAIENICETLDAEKPNLVIFTGDIVYGRPADTSLLTVLAPVVERNLPFAFVFGNHDDEFDLTRSQLFDLAKNLPGNLTATTPGITGITNFILPIASHSSEKTCFVMYFFDSNAYSTIEGVKGYDYIHFDQIEWYRNQSSIRTANNNGEPIPAVAFFHIPLPEYNAAAADEQTVFTGTRKEKACAPRLNSGLFTAIKETKDIMAIFVGHDHDNDYAAYRDGIMLAYGRYSGGNTVYNNLKPNGARIIELRENEKKLRTWIRLRGGNIVHDIEFPNFFLKEKE